VEGDSSIFINFILNNIDDIFGDWMFNFKKNANLIIFGCGVVVWAFGGLEMIGVLVINLCMILLM
jgi:hypothetical protein